MREAWGRGTSCLTDSTAGRSNRSARAFAVLGVCAPAERHPGGTQGAVVWFWGAAFPSLLPSPPVTASGTHGDAGSDLPQKNPAEEPSAASR